MPLLMDSLQLLSLAAFRMSLQALQRDCHLQAHTRKKYQLLKAHLKQLHCCGSLIPNTAPLQRKLGYVLPSLLWMRNCFCFLSLGCPLNLIHLPLHGCISQVEDAGVAPIEEVGEQLKKFGSALSNLNSTLEAIRDQICYIGIPTDPSQQNFKEKLQLCKVVLGSALVNNNTLKKHW